MANLAEPVRVVGASKWGSLGVLALCQVAAMALWFSASAVVPALTAEYRLTGFAQSLFTSGVQAGFVLGSLGSALLGLADRLDPRRFFMAAALIAAAANAAILLVGPDSGWTIAARVLTGACMAGACPVGMKLAATWAKGDMGLVVGPLVGALTLGSAPPHLFNALGGIDWRFTLAASSGSAVLAALWAWKIKPVRLANLGYLGRMWELYVGLDRRLPARQLRAQSGPGEGRAGGQAGDLRHGRRRRARLSGRRAVRRPAGAYDADHAGHGGERAKARGLTVGRNGLLGALRRLPDAFASRRAPRLPRRPFRRHQRGQYQGPWVLTLITIPLMPLWVDWLGWR